MSLSSFSSVQFPSFGRLTSDQEQELARRRQAGDSSIVDQLVGANLRLAIKAARRWTGYRGDCTADELLSHAIFGLFSAARGYAADHRFDDSSVRFSTYATRCINRSIVRGVLTETGLIRVPEDLILAVSREDRGKPLVGRNGRSYADAPRARVALKCRAYGLTRLSNDHDRLEDLAASGHDDGEYDGPDPTDALAWLAKHRPRHSEVIEGLYPLDRDQAPLQLVEIAERLGVSRKRVYEMREQAFRWLRKRITEKRNQA